MSDQAPDAVPPEAGAAAGDGEPPRPELAEGLIDAALAGRTRAPEPADLPPPDPEETVEPAGDVAAAAEAEVAVPDGAEGADPGAPALGAASIDVSDPDAEALSALPLATRVEALLFAATEPIPLRRLKDLTACPDAKAVRAAVDALAADYAAAARAFRIEEVAQGFQLRTGGHVSAVVARLGRRPAEERLSTAALETLAITAYRQPVLRADIEKIRGVACGEVLRALQERGLVRIAGRADLPGSPLLYGTTQRFLEVFGLRDLQELPKDRELLRPKD